MQAGAVHKMLRIAEGASGDLTEALVANFLCLSALDANKPIIGASGAAPFLVRAFEAAPTTEQARHDALRALLNLSIAPAGTSHMLSIRPAPSLVAVEPLHRLWRWTTCSPRSATSWQHAPRAAAR